MIYRRVYYRPDPFVEKYYCIGTLVKTIADNKVVFRKNLQPVPKTLNPSEAMVYKSGIQDMQETVRLSFEKLPDCIGPLFILGKIKDGLNV